MNLAQIHVYWFVVPLVIAISLVYSASRQEDWRRIFAQSARCAGMILGVLAATTAVLLVVNSQI